MTRITIAFAFALSACSLDVAGTDDGGKPTTENLPNGCTEIVGSDSGGEITCSQAASATEISDASLNGPFLACQVSCVGCCTLDGECHAGAADVQCGQHGWRCVDCTTYTATCGGDGMCLAH